MKFDELFCFFLSKHVPISILFVFLLTFKDLCEILARRCCFRMSQKSKRVASISKLNLPVLLVSVLPIIKLQMQFTTHVGDDLAKPVFKKAAAFVFKYQAVTSESGSNVRIFSPFPRIPAINLTQATYMAEAFKRAPDSIGVMYININCKYMYFNETYALLLQQLETRVSFLE